jgi:hypothetical protein
MDNSIVTYSTNVASYENDIALIYDTSVPLEIRRQTLVTIKNTYERLVNEFLVIYPGRSIDPNDYYQIDCMARPPRQPSICTGINEKGEPFWEDCAPPVTPLMPTDSISSYGGPAWYMRKHFNPDSTYQSHQAILDKPVDPVYAPYPSREEVINHVKRDHMQLCAKMKEEGLDPKSYLGFRFTNGI